MKEFLLGLGIGSIAMGVLVYKERYRLVLGLDLVNEFGEEIEMATVYLAMIYYDRGYLVLDDGDSILSWGSGELVLTH